MFNRIKLSTLVFDVPYEAQWKSAQEVLFNRKTFELKRKEEILESLNLSEDDFVLWDYDYVPLFEISLADTQRDYMITSHRKDCEQILKKQLDDAELEFYFRKELEFSEIRTFWWQHHEKVVKQKAIDWCNDYNIPYEDDLSHIKTIKMTQNG